MKTILFLFIYFIFQLAQGSNFEIKVAINLNDCINCSNYLYSLNSLSKKYKITLILNKDAMEDSVYAMEEIIGSKVKNYTIQVSDSLYKKYAYQSQNYITAIKNNKVILATVLKNINSQIEYLNELSFEDNDTISLKFKPEARTKSKLVNSTFYSLNPRNNSFYITNLINNSSAKLSFNREIMEIIFKNAFNGSIDKLSEIENLYKKTNEKVTIKIGSFDVFEGNIYMMVYLPYVYEITNSNLDTTIANLITLIEYRKGEVKPIVHSINTPLKRYDFSQHQINIKERKVFINVNLVNENEYDAKSFWICKCVLKDNIIIDTTDCISRPKLHIDLKLAHNFNEYKLDGDYLINNITNELINYKTKESKELKIPFNKIIPDKNDESKFTMNYSLIDFKIDNNKAQIIYYMDSAYHYLLHDIYNNKTLEKFTIVTDYIELLKSPPKLFSKNLFYIFPKNQNVMVLKEIKPIN